MTERNGASPGSRLGVDLGGTKSEIAALDGTGTARLRVVRDAPLLEPLLPLFFFPLLLPFALFASRGKIEAARWAESDHG